MKTGMIFLSLFFSVPLYAQSVTVLFPPSGHLTGVTIPFEVSGASGPAQVVAVETKSDTAHCKTMIDPYRPEIFHAKCAQEGSVVFNVSYREGGRAKFLVLPSFAVKVPDGKVIDPSDPETDPDIELGRTLFNQNFCSSCHTPMGESAAEIRNAINTKSEMSGLKSLSDSDLDKIAKYVRSL